MSDEEVEQRQDEVLVHPPIRCEELDAVRDDFRSEERHLVAALNTVDRLVAGLLTRGTLTPEGAYLGGEEVRSKE